MKLRVSQGDDGKIRKQEEDYTADVDRALPLATELAQSGKLVEAIESLLPLEKKARVACDMSSTSRITVHIVDMCYTAGQWDTMGEYITLLTKRRGQLKKAVTDMVQKACEYLESAPDKETTLKLIDTLRTVTLGKIHVEVERARLTRKLAEIRENEGQIAEAADVLNELQVETFGSMDRREKVDFILEQMRLGLARKDYIRTQIISKKVSIKFFEEEATHDLKLKYYNLMLELAQHEKNYLNMCKYYRAIFDTPRIQSDEGAWKSALQNAVLFLVLAQHDNEQSDLVARVVQEKKLNELPVVKEILTAFTTMEIVPWRVFDGQFSPFLSQTAVFGDSEVGKDRYKDLRTRVVEHNLRVMSGYYERVSVDRLSEILELNTRDAEAALSVLVSRGVITAKIDRPAGVVAFRRRASTNDTLNTWATSLSSLMSLLDKTTHLITKERMVHKV